MKKSLRHWLVLIALSAAFGSVVVTMAQQERAPIVGGYKEIAIDAPEVISAARFAVGAQGRKVNSTINLISVEGAERQTVAGANYRLCLKVETEDEVNNVDVTESVKVVVFRSLKNQYSLKSWVEEDCIEDE
ncbi:MAG TPA: cystatin domain-containing protein [Pyrinomonadaceae bacterium]